MRDMLGKARRSTSHVSPVSHSHVAPTVSFFLENKPFFFLAVSVKRIPPDTAIHEQMATKMAT